MKKTLLAITAVAMAALAIGINAAVAHEVNAPIDSSPVPLVADPPEPAITDTSANTGFGALSAANITKSESSANAVVIHVAAAKTTKAGANIEKVGLVAARSANETAEAATKTFTESTGAPPETGQAQVAQSFAGIIEVAQETVPIPRHEASFTESIAAESVVDRHLIY